MLFRSVGTTFRLYFPRLIKDAPLSAGNAEHTAEQAHTKELMHGTETILVVDDEEALQELVQVTLQALGYRVLTASNGEQAMQILSDEQSADKPASNKHASSKQGVDLLFSDVIMPGINGLELAERAHKQYPALKILLTSGYTEKVIAENRQSKFATNVLTKPYSQSDLTQRLRQMLDSHINNGS